MAHEHLQTLAVWKHLGQMQSIAMAFISAGIGAVKELAVMVETAAAIHDFVLPVAVHVTHCERVCTFAPQFFVLDFRFVEPHLLELAVLEIDSPHEGSTIVTATHYHRGMQSVKICHTGQVTV